MSKSRSFGAHSSFLTIICSLAYLEIYTVLATFFSRFDMELLSPTTEEGLAWSDHGVAVFKSPLKVRIVTDHWGK